jgi:hypothetical protein
MIKLELTQFWDATTMAVITAKDCLLLIQERAIKKWGEEKWLGELTRTYAELAKAEGDADASYVNRRSQIRRTFGVWGCNADTLLLLMACVGCRVQMVCEEVISVEKKA